MLTHFKESRLKVEKYKCVLCMYVKNMLALVMRIGRKVREGIKSINIVAPKRAKDVARLYIFRCMGCI